MSTPYNRTESGLVKTGFGKIWGIIVNSHTSGTLKLIDGTEGGVPATSDITSSGASAPASHATNTLTSTGAMVPAAHAVSVLTSAGVFLDGETITIGSIVYRIKSTPAQTYDILLDTAALTLDYLKAAINGTKAYGVFTGTPAHPDVVATTNTDTQQTIRGRVPGTSLDTKATTETGATMSWPDTTLGGGTGASDPGVTTAGATITIGTTVYTIVVELSETLGATAVANQVLYGGTVAIMLDNLKLAINATGTAGTNYSTGTVAHTLVVATTNADTTQMIRGRVPGTSLDTTPTTETLANTSWADTTLGGGTGVSDPGVTTAAATFTINGRVYTAVVELSETLGATAIVDQVLWVTSEAIFLDNIKKAINASGIAGTDYSTGTTVNVDVVATVNTNTVQTINAKRIGTAGNAITTSTTLANYAWTSTVLASGTGAAGKVLLNTITFASGPGFYLIDDADFSTGLYATVGGTLDYTLLVD